MARCIYGEEEEEEEENTYTAIIIMINVMNEINVFEDGV